MQREESRIDLFRYGIISPLVYGEEKNVRKYCEEASDKVYFYKGKNYKFSSETIRKWYYRYRNDGFDKLNKEIRKDKNTSRKLTEEAINYIVDLKSKYPKITTKQIYKRIVAENILNGEKVKINCFYRYIRNNELKKNIIVNQERRRYEKEYPNDTWQADTTYGPYIIINGKKYRVYLIHFIDDNSRLIVGHGFYLNDNALNVQKVLKQAISKYGIPKQIYLDNGSSYKNEQLKIICARLGIKVTHTHAYDPQAKGKVERCFKTIKEGWLNASDWNKYKTLEDIEKDYAKYLYEDYINTVHSELNDTPNNVWHKGIVKTKLKTIEANKLEEYFMQTIERKVSVDRTISINNELYEVPYKYIGQKIEVRYNILNEQRFWIYKDNIRQEECNLLNKKDNSKVKRKNNIDYEKLVNKEEDVEEYGL